MKTITFRDEELYIYRTTYADGTTAIELETLNNELYATATTNIGRRLTEDVAFIKNYSENTGILDMLIKEGIVIEVINEVQSGFVKLPLCQLNLDLLELVA